MDILIGGRGSGRTTQLIKACSNNPGSVIVCATNVMACNVAATAKRLNIDIPKPISFQELVNGHMQGRKVTQYYFDDLDLILQTSITKGVPVDCVSIEGRTNNIIYI